MFVFANSRSLATLGVAACLVGFAAAQPAPRPVRSLQPVPFTAVRLTDPLWARRQDTNRKATIPHCLDMLEKAGNVRNFELAAKGERKGYTGFVFNDSDVYKVLEAASFSIANNPDAALEARVDALISKVAAAQMADGYLDTYYQINDPSKRWTNLRDNHEMYCAGHLIEAAVAHHQATGKRTLLDVATKLADHLDRTFGPAKRMGYCGHPEIELALVKLWRDTGERRYFDLANFFVTSRGSHFFATEHNTPDDRYDGTYWLDAVPIREQTAIVGHAVRAAYLMSGVTDVVSETRDAGLLAAVDRVWRNATGKRMFVTGGIGTSGSNEGFTSDYDLPNFTAYQETCASISMVMWNQRLAMLYGDARYADIVETGLYNAVLAGVSDDGEKFFYDNPLASKGKRHRSPWFSCACCPPNVARTVAAVGGYAYATDPSGLWVNLFVQGDVKAKVGDRPVSMSVQTQYPWDGRVRFSLDPDSPSRFGLHLRIPGWSSGASVKVNGAPAATTQEGGYFVIDRTWKRGDVVQYDIPMPVRRIEANPKVRENQGRLALARGPLIYCVEGVDEPVAALSISLPAGAKLTPRLEKGLLGGVVTLKGVAESRASEWLGGLYQPALDLREVPFKAVPYFAWDNRGPGEMQVWIPTSPLPPAVGGPEMKAQVSVSFASQWAQPSGVNDGSDPKSSSEQPVSLCHFWPHKGGEEWIQYTWEKPETLSGSKVYLFDDTGRGECRFPASWRIEYLDGDQWKPVKSSGGYPIKADQWCEVAFEPVTTKAVRLVVAAQPNWSVGIRQWQVARPD